MRINIYRKKKKRGLFPMLSSLFGSVRPHCSEGGLLPLAGGSGLGLSGRWGDTGPWEDVQPNTAHQGLSQHTRIGSSALFEPGFQGSSPLW